MKALLFAFVAGSALALQAADLYVAKSGVYVDDAGVEHEAYKSIVEALNFDKSPARDGDTIWIEDGYVADNDSDPVMTSNRYGCQVRLLMRRALTIRSKSGVYDEAKHLGVTVKGGWHSETTPLGTSAIRCLRTEKAGAVCLGIIFDGGCEASNKNYSGGGAYADQATAFTNCLFRNCYGYHGGALGGVGGTTCYKCVFTNNVATGNGGAVYGASVICCTFENNTAANLGGSYYGADGAFVISNCSFTANQSTAYSSGAGGGAVYGNNLTVWNCGFTNNTCLSYGGAVMCSGGMYSNCTFVGNSAIGRDAYGQGGALKGGATLIECRFYDNISSNNGCSAAGGAVYGAIAKDCTFSGNATFGNGGAAIESMLADCTVDGNAALYGGESAGRGGGLCSCVATNCIIVNNWTTRTHGYGGRGGGAYDSTLVYCTVSNNVASGNGGGCYQPNASRELVRCLFVGNSDGLNNADTAGGVTGGANSEPTLVHCTLTGNGRCGVNHVRLLDCISWGNGEDDANIVSAVRSCASVLTDEMGEGNVTENPKLRTKPAGYVYWPANSKCYNMGRYDAYAIGLMLLLR